MPLFKQDASFFDGDPNEGDLSKAPPGVPQNFYDSARKQLTAFEDQLKRLPGGAGSEAAQQARNQFYANIQKMWDEFPAEDKAAYIEAQAAGNPHDPLSVEGRQWSANKETSDVRSDNAAVFDEFLEDSLPGIKDTIAAATAGDEAAYAQLEQLLNGIQDPQIAEFVGEYVSQAATAGASDEAMARNKADYERLIGLSDPTVTAEERLMQEMARRQMEQDLRSQRGAIMNDRQARGVSGSGDELTAMLMGQNELANRRAMEEMQVQANAQNRAMEALFGAADLGMQIRGAEAEESQFRGSAADQAARWNKELKQNYDKWRTETLDQVNKSKVDRGKTLYDARTGDNKNKIDAALGAGQLELSGRAGKTGQYSGDSDDVFEGNKREVDMEILKRSGGLKF